MSTTPTDQDYTRDLARSIGPLGISPKTRAYWIGVLRGWAEETLSPPQFDECSAVLDGMEDGLAGIRRAIAAEGTILDWAAAYEDPDGSQYLLRVHERRLLVAATRIRAGRA